MDINGPPSRRCGGATARQPSHDHERRLEDRRLRDLMVAYQDGAYGAFEELYAALVGPLRGWLTAATRDRGRAEDLAQETFLQLHRARHTYDPAYPVMPWAIAIARHVYLMDRRTASRRPRYVAAEDAPERSVAPDAERRLGGAPVREALGRVTPERRSALLLHHVGGWSFREIARKFGIRDTAAKLRSSRGMKQLRDELTDAGRPEGRPLRDGTHTVGRGRPSGRPEDGE